MNAKPLALALAVFLDCLKVKLKGNSLTSCTANLTKFSRCSTIRPTGRNSSSFTDMKHENLENAKPSTVRELFRKCQLENCSTSGMCRNFVQANVAILDAQYAKDFREFADLNRAPCPLLHQSEVGEFKAQILADESDIRTDLKAYKVYSDSKNEQIINDLTHCDWKNMVTFYFGCSFTFEEKLLSVGIPVRNIAQGKNVSMYTTSISCVSVGPFACQMVVSMRPIPRNLLSKTVDQVIQMDFAHGAPIHIGNPKEIGIEDLHASSVIGDSVKFDMDDVPVFWACGVTSSHALASANMPLAISHSPGSMFISDRTPEQMQSITNSKLYPNAKVICIREKTQTYSIISQQVWDKITCIEEMILDDPGKRGVKYLSQLNDLHHAAISLSQSAKSVAVITGFPCLKDFQPPIENDGISGAICIARAVQSLGKPVTFIVDKRDVNLFRAILVHCHQTGLLKHEVSVICLSGSPQTMLIDQLTEQARFSHLISIERPGRTASGAYCTMNTIDITNACDPIDELFIAAVDHPDVVTIGIGDGGNEIGMGKVIESVAENVKFGADIGTVISTDYLITAGVSNWGGYALAKAISLCAHCPVHDRYMRKGIGKPRQFSKDDFSVSVQQEDGLLKYLMSVGIRDGVTSELCHSVDGLDFHPHHSNKIDKIQNC